VADIRSITISVRAQGPRGFAGATGQRGADGDPGTPGSPGVDAVVKTLSTDAVKSRVMVGDVEQPGKVRSILGAIGAKLARFAGIATSTALAGTAQPIQHTGPVTPADGNVGEGLATAIGWDASGNLVRCNDPTCVSGLRYAGWCDTSGTIYLRERRAHIYEGADFGVVADWGQYTYTGSLTFSGFDVSRPSGSWIDEGFKVGMMFDVYTYGANPKPNDKTYLITAVTDLTVTVDIALTARTEATSILAGTDNYPTLLAMFAAMKRDAKLLGQVNRIMPAHLSGTIGISDTLHLQQGFRLWGDGRSNQATLGGVFGPGTELVFARRVHNVVLHGMTDYNGLSGVVDGWVVPTRDGGTTTWVNQSFADGEYATSANSSISRMTIRPTAKEDNSGNGLTVRTVTHCFDLQLENHGGIGLEFKANHAPDGGNANGSQFDRIRIAQSGSYGLYVSGGDANVTAFRDIDISGTHDYGVYETQTVGGNLFDNVQCAACGTKYSGTPVLPDGTLNHGTIGPCIDFRFDGVTSFSVVRNCYSEVAGGLDGFGRCIGDASVIVMGGNLASAKSWDPAHQPFVLAGNKSSGAPLEHSNLQRAVPFSGTVDIDGPAATITRSSGSWITDGYRVGKIVRLADTSGGSNDGIRILLGVTANVLTCHAALSSGTTSATITSEHDHRTTLGSQFDDYSVLQAEMDGENYWRLQFVYSIAPTRSDGGNGTGGAYVVQNDGSAAQILMSWPRKPTEYRCGMAPVFQNGIGFGDLGYNEIVEVRGTAPPSSGWWRQGDRVRNSAPSELGSGGSKYVITDWICAASGSQGTWVECRSLTGN
jgi:hypothetical protein